MKCYRTINPDPMRMFNCLRRLERRWDLWCSTMVLCCFGNVCTSEKALNYLDLGGKKGAAEDNFIAIGE